jgi:hypothetical protein
MIDSIRARIVLCVMNAHRIAQRKSRRIEDTGP